MPCCACSPRLGAGADVVSEGELRRALAAGIPPQRIVFSGVGKTAPGNVVGACRGHSSDQCRVGSGAASAQRHRRELGRTAPVVLRVNPDVDALTHAKIATGKKENKFGIDFDDAVAAYRLANSLPGIEPVGLAVHIGSQLVNLEPYRLAFERIAELVRALRGAGFAVDRLDLGGGLGIRYHRERAPDIAEYGRLVRSIFGGLGLSLEFEPGRFLAAEAGILVTRVLYIKERKMQRFVIVDAAMNDLIRPAMYDAWHDIVPVDLAIA